MLRVGLHIHILDDIIENVSQSAPALLPLFRSEQQLRLLALLFAGPDGEMTIGELAERADVAQATASREVGRLAEHGIVLTRKLGRNTLVGPNWALPWAPELRAILVQTVGVLGRLGSALREVPGVVEAFVFGSWAARYRGEAGPAPRDIDVVVVGDADLGEVRAACSAVESDLRVEINPVIVDKARWSAGDDPFVVEIRDRPLVSIRLTA